METFVFAPSVVVLVNIIRTSERSGRGRVWLGLVWLGVFTLQRVEKGVSMT